MNRQSLPQAPVPGRTKPANPYYNGPASDHFDGTVFFNPGGTPPPGLFDLLRWQFGRGKTAWPNAYPSPHDDHRPEPRIDGTGLRVTMIGHASLLLQTAGLNLLFDPVWAQRASPLRWFGPKRRNPPGVRFENLPRIDAVLVSHNHYDHFDLATLERLAKEHDPWFVTPLGNDAIMRGAIDPARIVAGDWHETVALPGKVAIHLEPVHHWSARGGTDRRMALWAGFVVDTPGGKIYHVGDTGFHDGINYQAAAQRHGGFRLAILPIGAYEPRWFMSPHHQNPDEAVRGHRLCGAAHTAGHHWGTFKLTNEGIEAPLTALDEALRKHDVAAEAFRPLRPGETWDVPETERRAD
ncbi:MAG: MBL fold metallo-hydrolase [Oricola sp.]